MYPILAARFAARIVFWFLRGRGFPAALFKTRAGPSRSRGSRNYFRPTVSFSGRSCDEPPTINVYSPGINSHPFFLTLKMERNF
jgi:hypothetical protein